MYLRKLEWKNIDNLVDDAWGIASRRPAASKRCKLYQRGTCPYGDKCKFAHVDGQLAIAHPSVVEEEDEEDDLIVLQAYMSSDEEDSCYEKATIESDEDYGEIISW